MDVSTFDQNTLLTWCDDLHQVKSNISQLQATLNSIVSKAPSSVDYKELTALLETVPESTVVDRAKALLVSSQVKVSVRLKQLFDQGKLPLLTALTKINFKSPNADKFVGHFLDYKPEDIKIASKEGEKDASANTYTNYPPVLLPITNESILITVLTDKSYRQPSDFLESFGISRSHNAKLALKGRAILELLLLEIVEETYPGIDENELCVLVDRIMTVDILSKFALGYNLIDSYKYNLSDQIGIEQKLVIFSNVFLAYMGGLVQDGYTNDEIKVWLKYLYAPIVSEVDASISQRPVTKLGSQQLDLILKKVTSVYNIQPDQVSYEFKQLESDPYVVSLNINGKQFGTGISSSSYAEAKERAANSLFEDHTKVLKMMETVVQSYSKTIKKSVTKGIDLPPIPQHNTAPPTQHAPQLTANMYQDSPIPSSAPVQPEPTNSSSASPAPTGAASLPPVPTQSFPAAYAPVSHPNYNEVPYSQSPGVTTGVAPYQSPAPYSQGVAPYGFQGDARQNLDSSAKNTLYALLGQNHINPIYKYQRIGNELQATVLANDVVLGVGYDNNKKLASQKAAMNAINNEAALKSVMNDLNKS